MPINVVMPLLKPNWQGGQQYIATLKIAARELDHLGEMRLVGRLTITRSLRQTERKYSIQNALIKVIDSYRSTKGVNFPRPLSALAKHSFAWIPDMQDVENPEFFTRKEIIKRQKLRKRYINNGNFLFFSSHHSLSVFNQLNLDGPLIAGVIRFSTAINRVEEDVEKYNLCNSCSELGFFYLPNQWWLHKNHIWALKAYNSYKSNGGKMHLILTGKEFDPRWPKYSAEQMLSEFTLDGIHRLGIVSRGYQAHLFGNARAVIQPSLYEGWSTTIEEALSFGTPIIASKIPANTEQTQGCTDVKLINPSNDLDLLEALINPPTKLNPEQIIFRNSLRWKRFLDDFSNAMDFANNLILK